MPKGVVKHEYAGIHFELVSNLSKICRDGGFFTDRRTVVSAAYIVI